ncbi:acyl-coenzyme A synthetase ACSM1, mitochondrial [Neophocaena asiaeorientalis asiaeorientalis]|uniref:Acyl-coenzyme A synthetase ACSM1, mitochondrial n=1 Tax=Neophocaena asiaeorientalis asiaeorientalis TaxID=1706337 RepID=A0A341BB35_NEOAA|nr:acyl-coenzyme A synthetase ACSM1, mitochondrial [Neophocaena asiaeorientalis asiaeorientalis]
MANGHGAVSLHAVRSESRQGAGARVFSGQRRLGAGRSRFPPQGLWRCFRNENRSSFSKGSVSDGATAEALDQPPCVESFLSWLSAERRERERSRCGFYPAPQYLRCQSLSGAGAARWNDYDTPEEFNFAKLYFGVSRKLLQLKTSDVLWCPSDTGWILAVLGSLLEPWTAGSTVFVHHLPQFDPKVIVQVRCVSSDIAEGKVLPLSGALTPVHISALPVIGFETVGISLNLAESSFRISKMEICQSCKVMISLDASPTPVLFFREQGISCGTLRGMKIKPGSMGKAIPPYDIQIIDDKGNILPPNTEGNIGIRIKPTRPIGVFMGYESNPVKTAEVECGDFYNSGDRATVDAEGYFWFLGRADDVINASGYRIGPAEVENALAEHPAVAESAVVSSPDPIRGEVVKAFIVLTPNFLSHDRDQLTKELQQHVKSVTAPYKYPRKVSESRWMGSGPCEWFWGLHCLKSHTVSGVKPK